MFTILSINNNDPDASITISTDKPEYIPDDVVELAGLYRNLSVNSPRFVEYSIFIIMLIFIYNLYLYL